jgi:hypothetical protein
VIGDCHTYVLKPGWDSIAVSRDAMSLKFFAAGVKSLRLDTLDIGDGSVVLSETDLRAAFTASSKCLADIDAEAYDSVLACGVWCFAYIPNRVAISEWVRCLALQDHFGDSLPLKVVAILRKFTSNTMYFGRDPLSAKSWTLGWGSRGLFNWY